ncbi:RNA-directed DNA polymerase, eukaryota, reverse transcriptase zinc-binding domain protein [Tanacetum coccineum]
MLISYITTVSFSICVNGESFGYFKGGRGLRQGDPISPYLFTLVMEIMSLIVQDKVEKNKNFGYHYGCKQMKLTHVCFADDLLILCNGDKGSVCTLKDAIEEFGHVSGLKPNYDKSTIIFRSMNDKDRQDIMECVPFKVEKLPVRYLGVPLTSKRIGVNNFLESIHIYWASVFLLPKTVIEDINKLLKGFLWSQGELSRGKAKIAWRKICRPKSQGGLGLKDLGVWNKAMIIKNLWHVVTDKNSLWVQWISTVKLKGKSVWAVNEEVNDSWGWKNILKLRDEVRRFIIVKIGNGEKASLMYDNWCAVGILQSFVTHRDLYNVRWNDSMVVKDIVSNGVCLWPEEWIDKYPSLALNNIIPFNHDKVDETVWRSKCGKDGKFTIKQAYKDLCDSSDVVKWHKMIWFTRNIPKHSFILWMAMQNRLVTQDKVRRWGLIDMMVCPLCKKDMDSYQHLFFQCEYSAEVWERIKVKAGIQTDKTGWNDLVDDMSELYCGNSIDSIIRRLSLAACVYLIWQERNWRIFRDEKRKPEEFFKHTAIKGVFGWQFYKEMLFYNKQVLKSLVQNATMRNGMLAFFLASALRAFFTTGVIEGNMMAPPNDEIVPSYSGSGGPSHSPSWKEDSFEINVLLEESETEGTSARSSGVARDEAGPPRQDYVVINRSFEASMRNRILRLEQDDSPYLLGRILGEAVSGDSPAENRMRGDPHVRFKGWGYPDPTITMPL